MNAKILSSFGMAACVALVISCFIPWAYYADAHIPEADRTFTGFFSYQSQYGKPAIGLILFTTIIFVCMIVPKVWAKRINLFLSGFMLAYAFRCYNLYTSCYNAYCPEKKAGIFIMLISAIIILIASVFPNMKIESKK